MSKSTEDKIRSLQTLCADLIICAKQQETLRQRLRDNMRTKGLTAGEPPNIKVPVKYAETIGITQAEAVGLANNTHALSARGKALEAVCRHFGLDEANAATKTSCFFLKMRPFDVMLDAFSTGMSPLSANGLRTPTFKPS